MKKLRVGVLLGGLSIEREVSFNSGRTICDHLDKELYEVVPLFHHTDNNIYILPIRFLYRGKTSDFIHRLHETEKLVWDDLPTYVDFVYIATHGKYAEDGRLQGLLEVLGVPYLGSKVFASALGMDKDVQKDFLKLANIYVPQGFTVKASDIDISLEQFEDRMKLEGLHYPLIVKPRSEGSSFGVTVVRKKEDIIPALHKACFVSGKQGQDVLVEECLRGMEFTCIILTDPQTGKRFALPPTEVLLQGESAIFDYEQKYMPGKVNERTPAHCSKTVRKKIEKTCLATMDALQFSNMARIDGFVTKNDDVYIIDANPLSGMGPATFLFRQAAECNMSHTTVINNLIKTELKNYNMSSKKHHKDAHKKRLKVAVLMGGSSNEREISLESGRNVAYKLSPAKYEVLPIFADTKMQLYHMTPRLLVHTSTREIMHDLQDAKKITWSDLAQMVDFAFLGFHGSPGEDGSVQGALEMLQIPYNGSSVFTSALCMDKYKTSKFLKQHGFATPDSLLVTRDDIQGKKTSQQLRDFFKKHKSDCVVKPHNDGCSVMVQRVQSEQELLDACLEILTTKSYALVEQLIDGTELTVGVVGNDKPRAFAPSQSIAKKKILSLEEKFLPGAGENQTPALLPKRAITLIQKTVEQVFLAVKAQGYCRIDCFYQTAQQSPTGKERVVILEINTLPALTPATCLYHQAAEEGLQPMDLLDEIIQLGLQVHKKADIMSVDDALEFKGTEYHENSL